MTIFRKICFALFCILISGCGSKSDKTQVVSSISHYNLKINVRGGDQLGTVAIQPNNIVCSSNCINTISNESSIELVATPSENAIFLGWSGECHGSVLCSFTMNENKEVTANFKIKAATSYSLRLKTNEGGVLQVNNQTLTCINPCELFFPSNEQVQVFAQPLSGYSFKSWSGDCSGSHNCLLTMTKAMNVEGVFSKEIEIDKTLSVNVIGSGTVTVENTKDNCTDECQYQFSQGTSVQLTASPASGYVFTSWSGVCEKSITCELTLDNDTTVSAIFSKKVVNDSSNTITITEPHGESHINYPIQIGRPFIKGEIMDFPQAVLDGVPILTQADIKQRYPDGSVKHAIISFILESLPANAERKITFMNNKEGNNTALTVERMIADNFNFDAVMKFSFPESKAISAREMLLNGHFEYWLKGPVATTVILKDQSEVRKYDLGSDEYRSIHPIYIVTFWPSLNDYNIRYISEISNTEALQDQEYDIEILSGQKNPTTKYQQDNVFHHAKTRWSKAYWHTTQYKLLSINHNISYLSKTKFIPNYDATKSIPKDTINSYYDKWLTKSNELFSEGFWIKYMPAAGGRDDLGIYSTWAVRWLFSGNWKMEEISRRQAELAGAWPFFIREGKADRLFDFNNTVPAIGKPISIAPSGRPSYWIKKLDWHEVDENDRIHNVAEIASNPWVADNAHHPDISSLQYLLTGDYFFLEQSYFSSAFGTGNNAGYATKATFGRGPTGSTGGLFKGQTRGQAWSLRTRAHTLSITPDEHPEKQYYTRLMNDAITAWEGIYQINMVNKDQSEVWQHGNNVISTAKFEKYGGVSPLNSWSSGTNDARYINDSILDTTKVNRAQAPWEQHIMLAALGRTEELGFCSTKLKKWAGALLIEMLTKEEKDPALFSVFVQPVIDIENSWFTTWKDAVNTYTESTINNTIAGVDDEYIEANMSTQAIAMGALSYLSDMDNHADAWQYIEKNILNKQELSNNPKWAILPREFEITNCPE